MNIEIFNRLKMSLNKSRVVNKLIRVWEILSKFHSSDMKTLSQNQWEWPIDICDMARTCLDYMIKHYAWLSRCVGILWPQRSYILLLIDFHVHFWSLQDIISTPWSIMNDVIWNFCNNVILIFNTHYTRVSIQR